MNAGISAGIKSRSRRATIGLLLAGIVGAASLRANSSSSVVLVPPADLPDLARQGGEAMFLSETFDGRTRLYVEQNQGAQLALSSRSLM
jgi:hypothetical protein